MMMETSDIFLSPQMDPGEKEGFDFLKHALFSYQERWDDDKRTLHIEGQVGKQETPDEVAEQIFEIFEGEDVSFLDLGGGKLSLLFETPFGARGIRCIEITIKPADA